MTGWLWLMAASASALFLVCLILKLREFGLSPVREISGLVRRPWLERLLVLFLVCGLVQYGATKGAGGGGRSADGVSPKDVPQEAARGRDSSPGESVRRPGEVTNLCFTGVCVSTNGVTLDVAWPTNMFPRRNDAGLLREASRAYQRMAMAVRPTDSAGRDQCVSFRRHAC